VNLHALDLSPVSDFASEEAVLQVAANIASEVALEYSCPYAYSNEKDKWIELGESLSNEYLKTRSEIALELLKKAGVRLAQFLNSIASTVRINERKLVEAVDSTRAAEPKLPLSANRFFVLSMDFDPDALVFDPASMEELSQVQEETETEDTLVTIVEPVRKGEPEAVTTSTATISPAEKKRLRNRRKKANRKRNAKLFEGVDLEEVVLIKTNGNFIVTSRQFGRIKDYFPQTADLFKVSFSGNEDSSPITFAFDAAFFGMKQYSDTLIAAALANIRNLPNSAELLSANIPESEEGEGSLFFQRVEMPFHPINGMIEVGEDMKILVAPGVGDAALIAHEIYGKYLDPEEKKRAKKRENRIRRKENAAIRLMYAGELASRETVARDKVKGLQTHIRVFAHSKGLILFILESTLKRPTTAPILACLHKTHDSELQAEYFLIVDKEIFEGSTTGEINDLLAKTAEMNRKQSFAALKYRRTIFGELEDLWNLHFSQDPDRASKMRFVKVHHSKPGDADNTFFKLYWSTNAAEDWLLPKQLGY
jgi:hypothetical protein